ncbi:MAG: hypothetical protein AVDCRST_MAG50-376, partial [uncultured Acidimicrobiales bacterium]
EGRHHLREPHRQHGERSEAHRRRPPRGRPPDVGALHHPHRLPGAGRRRPGGGGVVDRRPDLRGAAARPCRAAQAVPVPRRQALRRLLHLRRRRRPHPGEAVHDHGGPRRRRHRWHGHQAQRPGGWSPGLRGPPARRGGRL